MTSINDCISELKQCLAPAQLLTDPVDCYSYAYDNSRKYAPPLAVVFPGSTEQVAQVVACCCKYKIPMTPRGRGTGTAGGSIPVAGGVVISLERMNKIIHVDPANRMMQVEAGVLNGEVQRCAGEQGFFWPPDPSSANWCSVGGNLATNAGGPHAVKYGVTRDHVLGLTAVTGTGEIIQCGVKTTKGVVGYDLTRLLIGSEGTLALITEATLKLTPKPAHIGGLVAHYRTVAGCAAAIAAIMAQPFVPAALEFLDKGALTLIRTRQPDLVDGDTEALLMIEVDGSEHDIAAAQLAISQAAQHDDLMFLEAMHQPERLWAARKALSPLLKDIAPKKINEDVVVPVSCLPALLSGITEITSRYNIRNVNFGHAGNGNIHVNLLVNPDNADEMARAEPCLSEVFDLVIQLQGTLSGEHGVGQEKRPFVDRELAPNSLVLMKAIKVVFDPAGILNPGKVLP